MPKNDRLYDLMRQLDHDELLFLLREGLGITERKYKQYSHDALMDCISAELRRAAGHGIINLFRLEHEFTYKNILPDVANKLSEEYLHYKGYRPKADDTEEDIEKEILRLFELNTRRWWERLNDSEKEQFAEQIDRRINAELVNAINRRTYIKHRVTKEIIDSVVTKGIVTGMLMISAGGLMGMIGGNMLTSIGWKIVAATIGPARGIKILRTGAAGFSGSSVMTFIGTLGVGLGVFIPSTIFFYMDTDYKKTMPTIIMLLSKVHLNKTFSERS